MNNLAARMKTFSGSRLQQGIESLTPQITHSHDTELEDDLFQPNPVILDEFYDIIDEDEAIDTDDTAFNLLSDSTEALRRLEILQMNVNYPVSGYQMSRSTLSKLDTGIVSPVNHPRFNQKTLNAGIESMNKKLLAGILTVVVAALGAVFYKAVGRLMKKREKLKRSREGMLEIVTRLNEEDQKLLQTYFQKNVWANLWDAQRVLLTDTSISKNMSLKVGLLNKDVRANIRWLRGAYDDLIRYTADPTIENNFEYLAKELTQDSEFRGNMVAFNGINNDLYNKADEGDIPAPPVGKYLNQVSEIERIYDQTSTSEFVKSADLAKKIRNNLMTLRENVSKDNNTHNDETYAQFTKLLRGISVNANDVFYLFQTVSVYYNNTNSIVHDANNLIDIVYSGRYKQD